MTIFQNIPNHLKEFDCTIDGKPFDVYEFTAVETLSGGFSVTVTVIKTWVSRETDYVGKEALFTLKANKITKKIARQFHGIVCAFEEQGTKGRYQVYQATIVPELWVLKKIRNVKIFQDKTVPDIIADVLKDSGIVSTHYEFRLPGTYAPREYCVQYRENNLSFIKRLMAEEGIFFYHEIKESRHFLVFGNSFTCHYDIPGNPAVLYSEPGRLVSEDEFVTLFTIKDQITTGKVTLWDYDFERPTHPLKTDRKSDPYDHLEDYDYPGNILDDRTVDPRTKVRLSRETQKQRVFKGESVCRRFTAGHTFKLVVPGIGKETVTPYILTQVTHKGRQPQALKELADPSETSTYGNTFTCIPAETTFRPHASRRKPSVMGVQTAVVTGPETEEIYTDKYGRVKIQFHWDRIGKKDTASSCWVRVAQSWADGGFGHIFIPRIGQEVIVSFIDGDPDRPLVTGTVNNLKNMPPYSLPINKTRSTIKTRTTPGGDGFNELRFEDKKGQEEIYIHGQKDWNIEILNDKGQTIGHDETLEVKNDRTKTVGHDQKEDIKNDKFITVEKNHTESVGENMSIRIGKNLEEHTTENKTVTVTKNLSETVSENTDIRVEKNRSLTVNQNSTVSIDKKHTEHIGDDLSTTVGENSGMSVGKNYSVSVNDKITISAGQEITFTCGSSTIVMKSDGKIQINGKDISVLGNGNVVVKGKKIGKN